MTRHVAALLIPLLAVAVAAEEKKPLSVVPAVQTAKWAVKWWMPRHKEKLAEKEKMERVDLVFIGDSITHGWESGKGTALWDEYYKMRNALNLGFSGDRTEHVLWRLQHGAVDGISPTLAVVMIGTNNAGHRRENPKDTALGVAAIVDDLKKRLPKTKILLLAIFPRGKDDGDALRKLNQKTNELIRKCAADERVTFLDINEKFLDEKRVLQKSIMPDRLHPNAEGYRIWAAAMEPAIVKLMGEK